MNCGFVSCYEHTVDAKGRVFIPAKYRDELGERFYIYKSLGEYSCIRAYNETEWCKVMEKLNMLPARDVNLKRRILASTVEVERDAQGRLLLPEKLRKECGIEDKVCIAGLGQWVEIWNPETYAIVYEMGDTDDYAERLTEFGLA